MPLSDGSLARLMSAMSMKRDPPSSLVLVLEAVIVLLRRRSASRDRGRRHAL